MKIKAAQHVSGVLTCKQSPRGHSGFQTLFLTNDLLSQDEIRVIEDLVQGSRTRDVHKWQSYRLTHRRHIVTRTVPIPEPDEFGRRGRFFSHTLVFDTPDGPRFDDVLFDLLKPQYFLSSLDTILASENLITGYIPAHTFDVKKEWADEAESLLRSWSGKQLHELYLLMIDPRRLVEQGQHVAFVGSEPQILDALKAAFLLTPRTSREFCSFDTNADGSDAARDVTFWGLGFKAAVATDYSIDAAQRKVILPESPPIRIDGFSLDQLSVPLREAITSSLAQPSKYSLQCLLKHNYRAFIGEPIYRTLLNGPEQALTAADVEIVTPLGRGHRGLGLLLALKSGDHRQKLEILAGMESSAYRQLVTEFRTWAEFKPWQVFSPIFVPTWFELFRASYSMSDVTCAVAQVAEHGSTQDKDYLEEIPHYLDAAQCQELVRWLQTSPYRLQRLQVALDQHDDVEAGATSSGKSNPILRRLLHPFGK